MKDEMLSTDELKKILCGRDDTPLAQLAGVKRAAKRQSSPQDETSWRFGLVEYVRVQIEMAVEQHVLAEFRERQAGIASLKQSSHGCVNYVGDQLAPGCRDYCLKNRNVSLRQSSKCDLDCKFCYYYGEPYETPLPPGLYGIGDGVHDLETLRIMAAKVGFSERGIGWVFYEPFCDEDKIYPAMEIFRDAGAYQYMYTNGVAVTEASLKRLGDAGLNELRFNLAATNCSETVLGKIRLASQYVETVCIESPVFTEFARMFLAKKKEILTSGVRHIHLAELQITPRGLAADLWAEEGPLYRHKRAYVSPIKSRHLIYDLLELADKEQWQDVTVLDCSNELKLYRGVQADGAYTYQGRTDLPASFYTDALDRYDLSGGIRRW